LGPPGREGRKGEEGRESEGSEGGLLLRGGGGKRRGGRRKGRWGKGTGCEVGRRRKGRDGWVGGPLCEILNTPLGVAGSVGEPRGVGKFRGCPMSGFRHLRKCGDRKKNCVKYNGLQSTLLLR